MKACCRSSASRSSVHCDDNVAYLFTGCHVRKCFGYLIERIHAIDNRLEMPTFDQLLDKTQATPDVFRREKFDARSAHERRHECPEQVFKATL